ncbi:MAG TPA: hypothetical protein VKU82_14460, partial [Planctomycetaceae bacterium]|nr:hypothetical protein [Planctomycetaceae bacterium]
MEVSISECPSCGAVVMGDEQVCSGCGKQLPAAAPPPASSTAGRTEASCRRCGAKVPRGVLRCRDCGAFMSPEVEAAAMAQQAGRMLTPGGSSGGLVGGGAGFGSMAYDPSRTAGPAASSFAEVADDADFDLTSDAGLADVNMRDFDEGQMHMHHQPDSNTGSDDDFEMGDGSAAAEYAVAEESGPEAPAEAAHEAAELPADEVVGEEPQPNLEGPPASPSNGEEPIANEVP